VADDISLEEPVTKKNPFDPNPGGLIEHCDSLHLNGSVDGLTL